MSRSKTRTRRVKHDISKQSNSGISSSPSADDLVDKAHTLLAQSDFPLAVKFLSYALSLEPHHLEARELLGIAELEAGDPAAGRSHLLQLFPPHTSEPPTHPSPYLYLAQINEDPNEALEYYSTATTILENSIALRQSKVRGKHLEGEDEKDEEERKMAVTALVAMIEIWMSDLCHEEAAELHCDALISRALSLLPNDPEARLSLASIRMSQSRFDEAKVVIVSMYEDLQGKEPFDGSLPALPARAHLTRLLLEHSLYHAALDVLFTIREEDSDFVEGAYLEGWTLYLQAEALGTEPPHCSLDAKKEPGEREEGDVELIAGDYYAESMRALITCARLFAEQDYPDEGIGEHVRMLLEGLERMGVKPAHVGEEDDRDEGGEGGEWEDLPEIGIVDVEMTQ